LLQISYRGFNQTPALQKQLLKPARAEIEGSYPGAVKSHVLDMSRWRFGNEGSSINFHSYAIGPYAAGPFSCVFSTNYIKKLAKNPEILEK